jgi:hypothetical protein
MNRVVAFAILTLTVLGSAGHALANVLISVDKSQQRMSVSVNGEPRYDFVVSTGRAGFGTPNGVFHPVRMEETWFSKEYYNSPMPHSIFFHSGFAIHGSYEISHLGGPASHGCIRLHPSDAAKLYSLVQQQGMNRTTIVVAGQNPRRPTVEEAETDHRRPSAGSYEGYRTPTSGSGYPYRYDPYGRPQYQPYWDGYRQYNRSWSPYWGNYNDN